MNVEVRPTSDGGHLVTVEAEDGLVSVSVAIIDRGMAARMPVGDGTESGRASAFMDRRSGHRRVARLAIAAAQVAAGNLREVVNADAPPLLDATDVRTDEGYTRYEAMGGPVGHDVGPRLSWAGVGR